MSVVVVRALGALLLLLAASPVLADVTRYVGTGSPNCDHATIQAAINAASNANGVTTIRITRSLTYNNQQLDINGKNIVLTGGFADCNQADPDNIRVELNGINGTVRPLITVRGSTTFVGLYQLNINNNINTNAGAGAGLGGAIAVLGGPHTLVGLGDNSLLGNHAQLGGGLYVRNDFSTSSGDVNVLIGANVTIANNRGLTGGGGVWCSNAQVNMTFSSSAILGNSTQGSGPGGGIRAEHCLMHLSSAQAGVGSIAFNTAGGDGGGISTTGGRSLIRVYSRETDNPATVFNNIAGGVGGGIAIADGAQVRVWDAIIDNNIGRGGGGAVSVADASSDAVDASFTMRGDLVGAPNNAGAQQGVAVLCQRSLRCNRMSFNQAISLANALQPGAAILARSGGTEVLDSVGLDYSLYGVEVFRNDGATLIDQAGGWADGLLRGSALFANTASGFLIDTTTAADVISTLFIHSSTVAGNSVGGNRSIKRSANASLRLNFKNSIHWQPGKLLTNGPGILNNDVDFVLANDLSGLPPSTHNIVGDPLFVNPAPLVLDFHLQLASPAVDYTANQNDPTADHLPRFRDLVPINNAFGGQDLGAYERQNACGDDTIFCDGFDPP